MAKQGIQRNGINIAGIIIIIVIIVLIFGAIFAGNFFKSEEKLKVALRNGQNISFMVAAYNEEKMIKGVVVAIYNSKTNHIATVSILPKTFLSYSRMENFTLEESLIKKVSYDNIRMSISRLIGYNIDYHFFIEKSNLIRLIDIIGGVEIYSDGIKDQIKGVFIPAGLTLLDGDKSIEYLSYFTDKNTDEEYEQLKRVNSFVRSFMKLKHDFVEVFTDTIASNYLYKTVVTNMSQGDFIIFFSEIREKFNNNIVDFSKGMNNIILYCDRKVIPGYDYILQAKNAGDWVKKELADAIENIKSEYNVGEEGRIVVEILNGTDLVGFATRTKRYLTTFGFDILEIGNAQHDNYENTVVIMRTTEQKATKLSELIRCKRVIKGEEYKDKKIDVTLILGRDFNGKIVK